MDHGATSSTSRAGVCRLEDAKGRHEGGGEGSIVQSLFQTMVPLRDFRRSSARAASVAAAIVSRADRALQKRKIHAETGDT